MNGSDLKSRQAPRTFPSPSSPGSRSSSSGSQPPQRGASAPLLPVQTISAAKPQQDPDPKDPDDKDTNPQYADRQEADKDAELLSSKDKSELKVLSADGKGSMGSSAKKSSSYAQDFQRADLEASGSPQPQSGAYKQKVGSVAAAVPPAPGGGSAAPASVVHRLPSLFAAIRKGPACVQPLVFPLGQHHAHNVSEECLTLNVYTPSGCSLKRKGGEPLPVLFFVTGWRFYTLNWNGMFDWHQLASRGRVVVVVPNYRVGVIGFLSRDDNGTSNMGVRDVLLAWQWTRTHIGAFGGDPSNVVPLGHASGSAMISELLLKPRLLKSRRAILLSQSMFALLHSNRNTGFLRARAVGRQANCCTEQECASMSMSAIVRCLSNLSSSHLLETLGDNFSLPTLDATSEPFGLQPLQFPRDKYFFRGTQLLMGTNLHENDNLLRAWMTSKNLTKSSFQVVLERFLEYMRFESSFYDWIMAYVGSDSSREEKFTRSLEISSKVIHHCALTHFASEASKFGAEVHFFVLDEDWSAIKNRVHRHSSYGDDLYFISGSVLDEKGITAAQRRLAEELMDNVAAFAHTGKPGYVKGIGEWPLRSVEDEEVVLLSSNGSRVKPHWCKQSCAILMSIIKNRH